MSGKNGGCMGSAMGLVLGLGLVVWMLVEPDSFIKVFSQAGETFIELVRTVAPILERESGGG